MSGYLLPFQWETIDLAEGSRMFWKQLLPLGGEITYGGEKLEFSRSMLNDIVESYSAKAYDQVPFQFANDANQHPVDEPHNMDPKKFHGELTGLKLSPTGLYGKFSLTDDGVEVIKKNPKLGVSVSLRRNYERADGKKFPYALRHVLGTLDPKVVGMAPWSTVDMSNVDENEEVEDLTRENVTVPKDNKDDKKTPEETVEVPKTEWEGIKAYIEKLQQEEKDLDSMFAEGGNADAEKETVNASNSGPSAEVLQLSNEVAEQKFEREADAWIRQGVPPVMVDAARKVLGRSNLVEMSNDGGENDPRVVIRSILEEARGTVDLSIAATNQRSGDDEQSKLDKEFTETILPYFGLGNK